MGDNRAEPQALSKPLLEAELFAPVKRYFKGLGFTVYAEVAHYYRGIDLVAVKGDDHVAVELKLTFNDKVVSQARQNSLSFSKGYVAYPVKEPVYFHFDEVYWKLRESTRVRYEHCRGSGIGILQILPSGMIYEALEPQEQKVFKKMDFAHYEEKDDDVGGLPFQKGVSAGYHELESIKKYVAINPTASWQEIFDNVHTHYAHARSLSGAMRQWRGFSLSDFKRRLPSATPGTAELKREDI